MSCSAPGTGDLEVALLVESVLLGVQDTEAVAMTPGVCRATIVSVAKVPPSRWRVTS